MQKRVRFWLVDFQILPYYGYYTRIQCRFCPSDHYFYAGPLKAEKLAKHFPFLHSLPNYASTPAIDNFCKVTACRCRVKRQMKGSLISVKSGLNALRTKAFMVAREGNNRRKAKWPFPWNGSCKKRIKQCIKNIRRIKRVIWGVLWSISLGRGGNHHIWTRQSCWNYNCNFNWCLSAL